MEKQKVFSQSEVSLHSSKNDCWLIINGRVYDVTKFLDEHPGGDKVLVDASADGDASDAFEDVGHGTAARSIMNNYWIGVLEGSDPFLVARARCLRALDEGVWMVQMERSYQNKKLGLDIKLRSSPTNVANLVTFHTLKCAVRVNIYVQSKLFKLCTPLSIENGLKNEGSGWASGGRNIFKAKPG
ncbi:hypothetical protein MRB53_027627 [Persea americana]|uniref:Uncharacterized protein n=1 Tax=Persea americana TaxID=3435 RepID=A0ACC2LLK2_PERAE|nr:hypothetical protein MRB53_027627 [Persea americana]